MKRIVSLIILAVVLSVSLCSCSLLNAATAYGLYSNAAKKLEKAGGFEADCDMTMSFEILGEPFETSTEMNIKQQGENQQITTETHGITTVMTLYGDRIYYSVGSEKYSYNYSSESAEKQDFSNINFSKLGKEIFETIEVIKNEDGTKVISLPLDAETAKSFLGESFESVNDEGVGVEFKDIVIDFIFNDKNDLATMSVDGILSMDVMGLQINCDINFTYEFINFGECPTVEAPADAQSYEDRGDYSEAELN